MSTGTVGLGRRQAPSTARRTAVGSLVAVLAVSGVLGSGGAAALAGERVHRGDLEAALVGPTLNLLTDEDAHGTIRYRSDGSAVIVLPGKPLTDRGGWRIAGDLMCHRWQRHLAGEERCFVVERVAEGKFATSDDYLLWY